MIAMYDLEDNFINIFDTYKECAKYFETSTRNIASCISRIKSGVKDRIRDKKNERWVRLYKINVEEE